MPRLSRYALVICLLAVAAAVVSFAKGSLLGVVWVLIAGVTSNMWWYYRRKAKADAADASNTSADTAGAAAGNAAQAG
jgi:Flp pilus assembly protein TadB